MMNDQPSQQPPSNTEVTPVTVAPAAPTVAPKSSKKKAWIIGGIIAGVLALLGGGAALAYNVWYQNPEKVVYDALLGSFKAKSGTIDGDLTVKTDEATINLAFDSKVKNNDGSINVKATIEGDVDGEKLTVAVNGSAVVKEDTVYFKLDGVQKAVDDIAKTTGQEVPGYIEPIIKKVDGQWISVKPSDYEDISEETSKQQECIQDTFKALNTDDAMRDEVTNLYIDNKVIVVKEKIGSKSINGVGSLGYKVEVSKDATEAFVRGLDETKFGKALKGCDDSFNFKEAADAIRDTKDDGMGNITIELWASRFGHQLTQVTVAGKEDDTVVNLVLNPTYTDDVSIDAPEDTISMKQLISDIEKAVEEYYEDLYDDYYGPQVQTPSYSVN